MEHTIPVKNTNVKSLWVVHIVFADQAAGLFWGGLFNHGTTHTHTFKTMALNNPKNDIVQNHYPLVN